MIVFISDFVSKFQINLIPKLSKEDTSLNSMANPETGDMSVSTMIIMMSVLMISFMGIYTNISKLCRK